MQQRLRPIKNPNPIWRQASRIIAVFVVIFLAWAFVTINRAAKADAQVPAPPSFFPVLRRTGVNDFNAKLSENQVDPHWYISKTFNDAQRTKNPRIRTCQDRNHDGTDDNGNHDAITAVEGWYGFDLRAGKYFDGTPPNYIDANAPWAFTSNNARWIGQNRFGHSEGNGNGNMPAFGDNNWCFDPGFIGSLASPGYAPYNFQQYPGSGPIIPFYEDVPVGNNDSWPYWNTYDFSYRINSALQIDPEVDMSSVSLVLTGMADNFVGIRINGIPLKVSCSGPLGGKTTVTDSDNTPMCMTGFDENATQFTASIDTGRPNPFMVYGPGEIRSFEVLIKSGFSNNGWILTNVDWKGNLSNIPACVPVVTVPANPEPGQIFTAKFGFKYGVDGVQYTVSNVALPAGLTKVSGASSASGFTSSNNATQTPLSNQLRALSPQDYHVTWRVTFNGAPRDCPGVISIRGKPYVKVFGNDVAAAAKFADLSQTTCSGDYSKQIGPASWGFTKFNNFFGLTLYSGSSSQFGVQNFVGTSLGGLNFATNDGFYSSSNGKQLSPPDARVGLTFGNKTSTSAGLVTDYGGNGVMYRCVPDYFSASIPYPWLVQHPGGGTFDVNTIANNIPNSTQTVIFVDGDARIDNNIIYGGNGTWTDISQIPSFWLVVKGNIYIGQRVTNLDGVYVAQPKPDGTGGIVYTCSNQGNLWDDAVLYSQCQNKLTINGAVIARQVRFLRTSGTVDQSTVQEVPDSASRAAETINFSQEIYLATPPDPLVKLLGGGSKFGRYDSITSLPPIL